MLLSYRSGMRLGQQGTAVIRPHTWINEATLSGGHSDWVWKRDFCAAVKPREEAEPRLMWNSPSWHLRSREESAPAVRHTLRCFLRKPWEVKMCVSPALPTAVLPCTWIHTWHGERWQPAGLRLALFTCDKANRTKQRSVETLKSRCPPTGMVPSAVDKEDTYSVLIPLKEKPLIHRASYPSSLTIILLAFQKLLI